jgi:AraC-like DNA-binding protein
MDYNFYIFTIGAFFMFGFALHLLFTKYGNRYLNKLLALVMLNRAFQMLYFILNATGKTAIVENLASSLYFLNFAYPVCAYLYIRGFIKDESRLQKKDWFHFIPTVFALLNSVSKNLLDTSISEYMIFQFYANKTVYSKENFDIFVDVILSSLRAGLIIIYLFFIWRVVLQSGIIKNRLNNNIAINWILFVVGFMTLTNSIFLVSTFINITQGAVQSSSFLTNYGYILLCIIILVVIGFVFYNPKILYGYVFVSKEYAVVQKDNELAATVVERIAAPIASGTTKPIKNTIPADLVTNSQLYLERITQFMETKKPFLNGDYSIAMLSQGTAIPVHHCSYIINYVVGSTFRDWINSYRITHFIAEYPSKFKSSTTISIALDCGFNNKMSFYNAFKKLKGVSPTDYFISESELLPL